MEWFGKGVGHLVVAARAGCGKTSTVMKGIELVSKLGETKILYAVFNKKNQKEAEQKFLNNDNVTIITLNALALSIIRQHWPEVKTKNDVEGKHIETSMNKQPLKFNNVVRALIGENPLKYQREQCRKKIKTMLMSLVRIAKTTILTHNLLTFREICVTHCIDFRTGVDDACDLALFSCALAKQKSDIVSFDDQVWLAVAKKWSVPTFELICVDESQDLSLPQYTMIKMLCKPQGRMIFIGDDNQAIYGFRGNIENCLTYIQDDIKAQILPLSVTYRCPQEIVALASSFVTNYRAAPNAPIGRITNESVLDIFRLSKPKDVIISRSNAALVKLACDLLQRGKEIIILGKAFPNRLIAYIHKFKQTSISALLQILKELNKNRKRNNRLEFNNNLKKPKEEDDDDPLPSIIMLAQTCKNDDNVGCLISKIRNLFGMNKGKNKTENLVTLSTVHQAKGLEWDRVFLLKDTFRIDDDDPEQEEINLFYVAITRVKDTLYLCKNNEEDTFSDY